MSKLKDAWELVGNYCLIATKENDPDGWWEIRGIGFGLCPLIDWLLNKGYIDLRIAQIMRKTIKLRRDVFAPNGFTIFKFAPNQSGWRKRYQFCMKQAGEM
jgi:hypothetical protein